MQAKRTDKCAFLFVCEYCDAFVCSIILCHILVAVGEGLMGKRRCNALDNLADLNVVRTKTTVSKYVGLRVVDKNFKFSYNILN